MNGGKRLQFLPNPSQMRSLREDVRAAAEAMGGNPSDCETLALVVDELVNNAIEHGSVYRKIGRELTLCVGKDDGRMAVEFVDPEMPEPLVRDLAAALQDAAGGLPALDSERGRGLFLISVYLEELRVSVADEGGLRLFGRLAAG